METNKVILNGSTLIDLTEDTATVGDVRVGKTFHSADGVQRTGELDPSGTKDVFLYDPYGELIESYSKAQFLALTAYPAAPTLQGLTFQEYNWSLSDAKTYVTSYGKLNIGATYKTTSGLSEFDIELTPATGLTVTFSQNGNTNWGDGTSETTAYGSTHTYADYGKYTITCDATNMYGQVFSGSQPITVRLGENLRSFSGYAFRTCYNLKSITIPNNITSLGGNTFENCYNLRFIVIPNGITSISGYMFGGCYSLTSIIIPNTVTTIGGYGFSSCYKLTSITIPNSVTSIGNYAFWYCRSLASILIPNNGTSIENSAFSGCSGLASITLLSGLTSIGQQVFYECTSLTSITIPSSVTSIGSSAFSHCTGLTSVTIGSGVTSIDSFFSSCYNIRLYDFSQAISVPTLTDTSVFSGISALCKIVVPDSLYSTWITATNWVNYANYIYKASEVQL